MTVAVVMKESGVIIAVMVIGGRPASQTYETNVGWCLW